MASSGGVAWSAFYHALADSLTKCSLVKINEVLAADDTARARMVRALEISTDEVPRMVGWKVCQVFLQCFGYGAAILYMVIDFFRMLLGPEDLIVRNLPRVRGLHLIQ